MFNNSSVIKLEDISFSYLGLSAITVYESLLGASIGYIVLWVVAKLFKLLAKKDGLGVGDMEFLALIGAFLGPVGVWFSLMLGSFSGLIIGGSYLLLKGKGRATHIPFGPFLALGATLYFFFDSFLMKLFF